MKFPIIQISTDYMQNGFAIHVKNVGQGAALITGFHMRYFDCYAKITQDIVVPIHRMYNDVNIKDENEHDKKETDLLLHMRNALIWYFGEEKGRILFFKAEKDQILPFGSWLVPNEKIHLFKISYSPDISMLDWLKLMNFLLHLEIQPVYRSILPEDDPEWIKFLEINPIQYYKRRSYPVVFPIKRNEKFFHDTCKNHIWYPHVLEKKEMWQKHADFCQKESKSVEAYEKFLDMNISIYFAKLGIEKGIGKLYDQDVDSVRDLWDYDIEDFISLGIPRYQAKTLIYRLNN